jgi:hypothetical protein
MTTSQSTPVIPLAIALHLADEALAGHAAEHDALALLAAAVRAQELAYGESERADLRRALEAARELTEPDEPNAEYIRGQVNLIMDTFALYTDALDDAYEIITSVITHGITVDAGLSELAALTGAEV